jgi:hypothetical protein
VLKRWNRGLLAQILALAIISLQSPKKITQEWSKWEVRGLSFAYRQFGSKWAREREMKGYGGYLYPLTQKLAVGRGVPGNSGYMSEYSGHRCPETPDQWVLRTGNNNSETPGIRPDTPDTLSGHSGLESGHFGLDSEFHRKSLLSGRIVSHGFYRFSWAQLPRPRLWIKVPLDSTAFLYSISKIKSSLLVHLRTPLFISFLRVHTSLYALLSHP